MHTICVSGEIKRCFNFLVVVVVVKYSPYMHISNNEYGWVSTFVQQNTRSYNKQSHCIHSNCANCLLSCSYVLWFYWNVPSVKHNYSYLNILLVQLLLCVHIWFWMDFHLWSCIDSTFFIKQNNWKKMENILKIEIHSENGLMVFFLLLAHWVN